MRLTSGIVELLRKVGSKETILTEAIERINMVTKMIVKNQIVIPKKQWQKFENWAAKTEKGNMSFDFAEKATAFLKKSIKKK